MLKTVAEPEAHAFDVAREREVEAGDALRSAHPLAPAEAAPADHAVQSLQRSLGNGATRRILQPKLTVGAPDDVYEKEADAVAEEVMARTSLAPGGAAGADDDNHPHRSAAGERAGAERLTGARADRQAAQRRMLRRIPIRILQQSLGNRAFARLLEQTHASPSRAELRRSSAGQAGAGREAPPIVEDVLATSGRPLADSARRTLEPGFGHDFGGVRVHDDAQAAESASAVSARAYTVGRDIVFGAGEYSPGTSDGQRLLAHELTHVVQQGGAAGRGQASRSVIQRDVGSDDYNQGYKDGQSGAESSAGPRDGDALTDYTEGYAKGHYEFSQGSSSGAAGGQTPGSTPGQASTPPSTPGSGQAPAPSSTPASGSGSGSGPAPAPDATNQSPASGPNTDSPDYKQGYQDGLSGGESHSVPRAGDAATDYDEGYAKGQYEFSHPSPGGASGTTPGGTTPGGTTPDGTTPGGTTPGAADTDAKTARLDQQYRGWLGEQNWPLAAESLNGFSEDDIKTRLGELSQEQIANIHQGALDNPRVGAQSQVALMTGTGDDPSKTTSNGDTMDTIKDLAKSKGLVIAGEQIGKKFGNAILGGIIGWAVDFATSPGGDTSLPHVIYQAVVMSEGIPVPVPGAEWHRKKENAQKDVDAYKAKTGQDATIDEDYSKDPDDQD